MDLYGCISRDGKEEKKLLCLLFGLFLHRSAQSVTHLRKAHAGRKGAIEPLKLISVRPCTLLHRRFLLSCLRRPNFGIRNCQTKFLFRFPLHAKSRSIQLGLMEANWGERLGNGEKEEKDGGDAIYWGVIDIDGRRRKEGRGLFCISPPRDGAKRKFVHSASSSAAKCDFADRPSSSFSSPGAISRLSGSYRHYGGGERDCSLLAQTRRREKDTGRGLIAGKKMERKESRGGRMRRERLKTKKKRGWREKRTCMEMAKTIAKYPIKTKEYDETV